jgi:hypothetical protein
VLERNGLVLPQEQRHQCKYRRWQRDAPMQLWQLEMPAVSRSLTGGRPGW